MAICILCHKRKAKRQCPAVYNLICAICCGTHRLKRLNCPSSCPYLQQAQAIEMAQKEREWSEKNAARARMEEQVTAYGVQEAVSTFAAENPDLTDREVLMALSSVQDAVEREVLSGIRQEPQATGRVLGLAKRILENAQKMRQRIGIPHNVLLARVCRLVKGRVAYIGERSKDGRGYIRSLRIDVPPQSLDAFLNRLTASVRTS